MYSRRWSILRPVSTRVGVATDSLASIGRQSLKWASMVPCGSLAKSIVSPWQNGRTRVFAEGDPKMEGYGAADVAHTWSRRAPIFVRVRSGSPPLHSEMIISSVTSLCLVAPLLCKNCKSIYSFFVFLSRIWLTIWLKCNTKHSISKSQNCTPLTRISHLPTHVMHHSDELFVHARAHATPHHEPMIAQRTSVRQ